MKKLFLIFSIAIFTQYAHSQSIGIGPNPPDPSALLDVNSTSRGLLVPSMTTSDRITIDNPADGLLVYDLTLSRFYQFQNGIWRFFIHNDYWSQSSTRPRVYNLSDSIGIGTSLPKERLHVSGNIKATNDLITKGEIVMNNPSSIFQMQNAGVNKAYAQLSGDNLRMGTNSGNATGKLVIKMNLYDRLTVNEEGKVLIGAGLGLINPTPDLDINGTINVSGTITKTSLTGGAALLPHCYGTVSETGTVVGGTGNFTSSRVSIGRYRINCPGVTANSVVIVNIMGSYQGLEGHFIGSAVSYNGYFDIKCFDDEEFYSDYTDAPVQFIVFK